MSCLRLFLLLCIFLGTSNANADVSTTYFDLHHYANSNTTHIVGLALMAGCNGAEYNYDIHSKWKFDFVVINDKGHYHHSGTSVLGCYKDENTGKLYYRVLNLEKTIKLQDVLAAWVSNAGPEIKLNINEPRQFPYKFKIQQ